MKNLQIQLSAASLAVTTISAIYQAYYIAPNYLSRLDHLHKKMDILYTRNGMILQNKPN
jgi:hypothetical protein